MPIQEKDLLFIVLHQGATDNKELKKNVHDQQES
jgi:hypothetical protein